MSAGTGDCVMGRGGWAGTDCTGLWWGVLGSGGMGWGGVWMGCLSWEEEGLAVWVGLVVCVCVGECGGMGGCGCLWW